MAKKKTVKWYDVNELFSDEFNQWQYAIIFSGRGLGKSYSTYKYMIDKYFEDGSQGMILKRFESDMKGSRVSALFSALEPYVWDTYQMKIRYFRNAFYFYIPTEDNKMPPIGECELFCYTGALNISDRLKGMNFPKVKTICLEEFMSMNTRYLPDEPVLLMNIVSTVFRHRTDGKVFLLGNTISKYDPYSSALGIKLYQMEHGQIKELSFKDERGHTTNFILHRAINVDVLNNDENKANVSFSNFGDNGLGAMISSGEFQTAEFPHQVFGYFNEEISDIEYQRLVNKGYKLRGVFTYEDNLPIYFKFNESYYQCRVKIAKTDKEFFDYNGQTLVGVVPISEQEFLNKPKTVKPLGINCQIVITNTDELIISHHPIIIVTNLQTYHSGRYAIDKGLDFIRKALANNTIAFYNNTTGQDVSNVLRLQNL